MARPRKWNCPKHFIKQNSEQTNSCWLWKKCLLSNGYVGISNQTIAKEFNALTGHQLSYIVFKGDYNRNLYVLHKCNIKHCVNPDHLYLGTCRDNALDSLKAGTHNKVKLTQEQVKSIRLSTKTVKELATEYKISETNIRTIIKYNSWKHI